MPWKQEKKWTCSGPRTNLKQTCKMRATDSGGFSNFFELFRTFWTFSNFFELFWTFSNTKKKVAKVLKDSSQLSRGFRTNLRQIIERIFSHNSRQNLKTMKQISKFQKSNEHKLNASFSSTLSKNCNKNCVQAW